MEIAIAAAAFAVVLLGRRALKRNGPTGTADAPPQVVNINGRRAGFAPSRPPRRH